MAHIMQSKIEDPGLWNSIYAKAVEYLLGQLFNKPPNQMVRRRVVPNQSWRKIELKRLLELAS